MLRITCNCGKSLKVDDSLLGKKIKCPACSAVQVVKNNAESAIQVKPRPAAVVDDDDAPPPPKKKAPPAGAKAAAPAKHRPRDDEDDEEEDRPRKKKKGKKQEKSPPWALIGGGVAALVVIGGAAAFFMMGPSAGTETAKKDGGGDPKSRKSGWPVPIKMFAPHKKGDKREIKLVATLKEEYKVEDTPNAPPELRKQFALANFNEKWTLQGEVLTLDVNSKGEETKVELAIKEIKLEDIGGNNTLGKADLMPKEILVLGTRANQKFVWSPAPARLERVLREFLADRVLGFDEVSADTMFGSKNDQPVGGQWSGDMQAITESIKKTLAAEKLLTGDADFSDMETISKFAKTNSESGKDIHDVEVSLGIQVKHKAANDIEMVNKVQGESKLRIPADGATGPLSHATKLESKGEYTYSLDKLGVPGAPPLKVNVELSRTTDVQVKYTGNIITNPPETKDDDPPSQKLNMEFSNFKIAWNKDNPSLNVSVDYSTLADTKPNPNATYVVSVLFKDITEAPKAFDVLRIRGSNLKPGGTFANPLVNMSAFFDLESATCQFRVAEVLPFKEGFTVVARQTDVPVTGQPLLGAVAPGGGGKGGNAQPPGKQDPAGKPANQPPPGTGVVELSNGRVEQLPSKTLRLTFDYKMSSGKVDPSKAFRVMAKIRDPKKAGPSDAAEVFAGKLQAADKFTMEFAYDAGAGAEYEVWLTEFGASLARASNTLVGQVSAPGASVPGTVDSTPGAKVPEGSIFFEISQPMAVRAQGAGGGGGGGGKKGGAGGGGQQMPQTFQLQFAWKLSKGKINPQAYYGVMIAFQGFPPQALGGQAVLGKQFQANGTYSNVLPIVGANTFEIYIAELLPGQQQPQIVSDKVTGTIR